MTYEELEVSTEFSVKGLAFCHCQHMMCSVVIARYIFNYFRVICALQIPAVNLVGNVLWFPEQFLLSHLMHMVRLLDKKIQETAKNRRQTYLHQKAQSLPKEARTFCLQVQEELT